MGSPHQFIIGFEMKWTICLLCVASVATALPTESSKKGRAFSLFSVVTFPNEMCMTQSTPSLMGICITAEECKNNGAITAQAQGNCASGFGVCCFRSTTPDGAGSTTINQDIVHIQSPQFPAPVTALNGAQAPAQINRAFNIMGADNVCQIRFDFVTAAVQPPNTNANSVGECTDDQITATTTTRTAANAGIGIRALCGTLTGQHLYVDVARDTGAMAATLNINTGAVTGPRTWNIKVRQVRCDDDTLRCPLDGCRQCFSEFSARISSFNGSPALAAGFMQLQDLDYSICIRAAPGMCGIRVEQATPEATAPDAFALHNPNAGQGTVGTDCTESFIELSPGGALNRFCGDVLTSINSNVQPGPVTSTGFTIGVVSDNSDKAAGQGFDLIYTQVGTCP